MNTPLLVIAKQELLLATRSRWMQIVTTVFAILSLAVAASSYILSGGRGVQDFARTSVSLLQLVTFIVPLAALVIGVLSIGAERGYAEVLFSQPVSRTTVAIGQMLGIGLALVAAEAVGFGAAGLVIFSNAGGEGLGAYVWLWLAAALLTAIFVSIATFLGVGAVGRKRTRALALAVVVWFALVVLFDVFALGAASLLSSRHASRLLIIAVILNPIDAIRTAALLATEGTAAFGPASLAFLRFTRGTIGAGMMLGFSIVAWIVAPAMAAFSRLRRCDI